MGENSDEKGLKLRDAAQRGDLSMVYNMLDANADVNDTDEYKNSALHHASREGHLSVVKVLIEAKAKINRETKIGQTPLQLAANRGHHHVVQTLVNAEAKINKRTGYSAFTALHFATKSSHAECVKILLDCNADTEILDLIKKPAKYYAKTEEIKELFRKNKEKYAHWDKYMDKENKKSGKSARRKREKTIIEDKHVSFVEESIPKPKTAEKKKRDKSPNDKPKTPPKTKRDKSPHEKPNTPPKTKREKSPHEKPNTPPKTKREKSPHEKPNTPPKTKREKSPHEKPNTPQKTKREKSPHEKPNTPPKTKREKSPHEKPTTPSEKKHDESPEEETSTDKTKITEKEELEKLSKKKEADMTAEERARFKFLRKSHNAGKIFNKKFEFSEEHKAKMKSSVYDRLMAGGNKAPVENARKKAAAKKKVRPMY